MGFVFMYAKTDHQIQVAIPICEACLPLSLLKRCINTNMHFPW